LKELREYQIPHAGLKDGVHHFNYEIGPGFFTHFEGSQISEARIFIDLAFDKKDRLFVLNFDISGSIRTECDRCGQPFDLPVHGNHTIYVKVGDAREEDVDSEEVVWISEGEAILDVSGMIYEFIHLSIPMHITHPDRPDGSPGCDPEILKLLSSPDGDQSGTDPRWNLLDKLNKN
jgi:uncharacterized metal-binding protein YceD (DUF177 family)